MSTDGETEEISPDELAAKIEAGEPVSLLDVRNREEIDAWRIEGESVEQTHVPYMQFAAAKARGEVRDLVDPEGTYVAVCPRGEESREVAEGLSGAGVDVVNLAGGMRGWAEIYLGEHVAESATDATVVQYRRPATGCLSYAVVSRDEAVVVDPLRAFVQRYREDVDDLGASIAFVVDTHVHADHLSGLADLARATGATPHLPEGATERGLQRDVETFADGETIEVGGHELSVLATPGHTTEAVSFRLDEVLFSGDTLFVDGTPRPDLQNADAARELAGTLHGTLTERLADLPDETVVAPGHYVPGTSPTGTGAYTATLGDLRERLPAFSLSREAFVERVVESAGEPPANFERIVAANLGRESVDGETAFELELGPNNCALATE